MQSWFMGINRIRHTLERSLRSHVVTETSDRCRASIPQSGPRDWMILQGELFVSSWGNQWRARKLQMHHNWGVWKSNTFSVVNVFEGQKLDNWPYLGMVTPRDVDLPGWYDDSDDLPWPPFIPSSLTMAHVVLIVPKTGTGQDHTFTIKKTCSIARTKQGPAHSFENGYVWA